MSTRSLVRPEGSPSLHYSYKSQSIKEEDIVFVVDDLHRLAPHQESMEKWDLFCLCDGHGGREAAEFAQEHLPFLIASTLPLTVCPADLDSPQGQKWLSEVRSGLNKAFIELDASFTRQCAFPNVGCTLTVALLSGWVLTVANVGDSEAFLDLGNGKGIELTTSDRIDTNKSEQSRLRRCGNQIRALSEGFFRPAMSHEDEIGPLRVWPCGLAVSRSIGDQDCGNAVIASPHIKQITIPFSGARLIVASDGLWDHLTPDRVIKRSRKHIVTEVSLELIYKARDVSEYGLTDDTSVLAIDVVPTPKIDFKEISKKVRGPRNLISKFGKRFGRNKNKGVASLVLRDMDMAEVKQGGSALETCQSSKSIGGSQRPRPSNPLTRFNTFTGGSEIKHGTDSEEEDSTLENKAYGMSLMLDQDEGPSQAMGSTTLDRFRSSTLE